MPWTESEVDQLIIYWNKENKRSPEIGKLLNKTPPAVISKIKLLRRKGVDLVQKNRWGETDASKCRDLKERICLKCQNPFLSHSPFNRICRPCKQTNDQVHSSSIMNCEIA